ncbi:MAG TPA: RNA polymerase sigma factor [Candidatus Udaeobacter sp.]|jgi:RNA polymerase sigma-70 factor (ECF subfamily)
MTERHKSPHRYFTHVGIFSSFASHRGVARADFEQLVDAHYAALYRFAFSLAKNEMDAADLTQQTFYIWAEKGHELRDAAKAKTWLFTTIYREFLGRRRHETRFPKVAIDEALDEAADAPVAADKIDAAAALEALGRLEENYRAPVTLFYLKQFSYTEIADVLNVPIGTVMSRLSRGKAQLRQLLSEQQQDASRRIIDMPGTIRMREECEQPRS